MVGVDRRFVDRSHETYIIISDRVITLIFNNDAIRINLNR